MPAIALLGFYHWLAYFYGLRQGRTLKPHHVRDGAAFAELSVQLQRRGLQYGRLVPNGPPTPAEFAAIKAQVERASAQGRHNVEDIVEFFPIDDSFLKAGDLVVVPTRPPLNDLVHCDKVRSQPGFTTLEQIIFRELRPYLKVCSRAHVRLSQQVAEWLPEEYANRADITFRQVKHPWYMELARLDGSGRASVPVRARQTAAYVLYLRSVERLRGADLLIAFGMGGTQTLVLCHRLRNDLAALLDRPGFKLIEMTAEDDETLWGGLEKAQHWKMDVVVDMESLA